MSKTTQYVLKGVVIVAALLASLLLIAPYIVSTIDAGVLGSVSKGANVFDNWEHSMEGQPAELIIMTICYSIVFFLGLIMAVLALVGMFIKPELIGKILKIVGIVLAVLAIVGLICNFVYVNGQQELIPDASSGFSLGIGVGGILSAIFSVIAAATVYAEKALK